MPVDLERLGSVQRMRRKLAEVGPDEVRTYGDFDRVSVPDGDADVLRDGLLAENARVVIEIGLAYGSSALASLQMPRSWTAATYSTTCSSTFSSFASS